MTKVLVVGGGAIGLTTALELAGLGADATVIEKSEIGSESSGLSAGIVETQYLRPLDIELRVWSMHELLRLEREAGLDITHNGYLRLGHNPEHMSDFEKSVAIQRDLGVQDATVLTQQEIAELIPDIDSTDILGGLFGPSDGFVDGHQYCSILAGLARSKGVSIMTRTKLLEASTTGDVFTMQTDRGPMTADVVVNAAGGWLAKVASLFGSTASLVPQRHQAAIAQFSEPLPYMMPSVMDYTPHSGGYGLYFRYERPDQLLAGLHTEEPLYGLVDPDVYKRSGDSDFVETVAEKLMARLPTLAEAGIGRGWAGIYPVSPDGIPQVGPSREHANLIFAGGAGGSGLQTAPVLGRLAAEWVVFGEPRSVSGARELAPTRPSLKPPETSPTRV